MAGFINRSHYLSIKMQIITSYTELEDKLRQALKESNQSLQDMADSTSISKTHLANFKNGKRNLSFQNLNILAKYFSFRYNIKNY